MTHLSLSKQSSLQEEVRVEHKTKTCVGLGRVRCKEEEEEDDRAFGTFNEGNGRQIEHRRNSLVIVKSICLFL